MEQLKGEEKKEETIKETDNVMVILSTVRFTCIEYQFVL